MCTVTYVPSPSGFLVTSNRDEYYLRETLPPAWGTNGLLYPKDTLAGGTWIATDQKGRVACLLNGAFEKHKHEPPYRKSRGQLLLEAFDFNDFESFAKNIELDKIEPFTLILITNDSLLELRWDEKQKHLSKKDTQQPQIWASAPLYDKKVQEQRREWFNNWLQQKPQTDRNHIFDFHQTSHGNDIENDVIMKRSNGVETVSICQVGIQLEMKSFMRYQDLRTPELSTQILI